MQQGVKHTIKTNGSYYMTMTVVAWADVFTRKNHKQAIVDSLRYCIDKKGLNVYAYCIMTNHLHLIANCDEPFQLKDTVRDFKRHSARTVLDQILNEPESRRENLVSIFKNAARDSSKSKTFKFWKTGNHAIELYSEKFLWDKINYTHNNPVSENFVSKPEHWLYSSASNYLEEESILPEITVVPQMMKTIT
ncbi:REP-associated tyrosine transposase [Ulvibacterium marinum]|uniref:REP-associated tyrosine transposase n=1 Tax=Ulvibacterium marinum TaxID=2419782 RepID=UPI002494247A|nr:transposase [Ulvibacterium marinum]